MVSLLNTLKTPVCRRILTIIVVLFAAASSIVVLMHLTPGSRLLEIAKEKGYEIHIPGGGGGETASTKKPDDEEAEKEAEEEAEKEKEKEKQKEKEKKPADADVFFDTCSPTERIKASTPDIFSKAKDKYSDLLDDKFTIAIQTYRRPRELKETLGKLTDEEIPSLLEIVVVWNDLEDTPPADFESKHGVPVRYRVSRVNSLNEKLWPDPEYRTQAILLSDDDVYYEPKDLEFVFQSWRKFGRNRMTGALARCAELGDDGQWDYTFCPKDKDGKQAYDMVLTNLSFAHIALLDYYSSEDTRMKQVRAYVDKHFNCEDIAMNHVTGLLTGEGPLLVRGREAYHNQEPSKGISTKPGHLDARSQCINDFADIFGCMALVKEEGYVGFGA